MLVVILLWRPTQNNQRYAYSPLTDGPVDSDDDVDEVVTKSGAIEGLKEREVGKVKKIRKEQTAAEDDLAWIEENIPQTVAEDALPAVVDDEEEGKDSRYQMN